VDRLITRHLSRGSATIYEKICEVISGPAGISGKINKEEVMKKVVFFLVIFCMLGLAQTGARYLIITHDNFYDAIQPLAQWKHKKGMSTKVAKLSETGSSASQIRNYIVTAYNNWQIRPEFILFVGAPNLLPFPTVSGTYSDNYYTNMDADIFNEILSGRLTVHNTTEAQTVVNKMLLYERTPYMTDTMWFIRACAIVRQDYQAYSDSIYWSDVHQLKNQMLSAGYNLVDTLSNRFGDDYDDVIQRVNLGRSFVIYRGQGVGNWWGPFDVNPDLLANGPKLPIVCSFTCQTIGTSSTPATAERWFLTGTPTTPRGASGYFATTTIGSNIAHLRSAVCKGFFNSIFISGKKTFGEACEGGRTQVYLQWGSASEYYGFTTIGDPEMNIWTASPRSLDVDYADLIYPGNQNFTVTVTHNGDAVQGAAVCLMKDTTVYVMGRTNAGGSATMNINPVNVGTMDVTVTGPNYVPFEGTCQVISAIPNLAVLLVPDAIMVPRGGQLGYTANVTNNTDSSITFQCWVDIILWTGQPYAGNPIFGPYQVTVPAGQSKHGHLTHTVPNNAPLQTYTCYARIGGHPDDVWAEDYFQFTVIASEYSGEDTDDWGRGMIETDF